MERGVRHWVPESTPLVRVFWLYGVVPSNLLWALLLGLLAGDAAAGLVVVLAVVLLVYTGWIVAAVWAAADNVHGELYSVLARWLTVAWSLNTLLFLGFLMLDLAAGA